MTRIEADFNRIDRRGRIKLSGTHLHADEDLEMLATVPQAMYWFQDGGELVPGRIEREGHDWYGVVDWDRQYEEPAQVASPVAARTVVFDLPSITMWIPRRRWAVEFQWTGTHPPMPHGTYLHGMTLLHGNASPSLGSPRGADQLSVQHSLIPA